MSKLALPIPVQDYFLFPAKGGGIKNWRCPSVRQSVRPAVLQLILLSQTFQGYISDTMCDINTKLHVCIAINEEQCHAQEP
jgi:hypothetical protein